MIFRNGNESTGDFEADLRSAAMGTMHNGYVHVEDAVNICRAAVNPAQSNDYQTPMVNGEDHPLKYVNPAALASAREALASAVDDLDDPGMVEPLADLVVMHLKEDGHLRPALDLDVLVELARSVRGMVQDGHPCSGGNDSADEWFKIMCNKLHAVEALVDLDAQ